MMERGRTPPAVRLQETRGDLLEQVKVVGKSGDLDLILTAERTFLQNDLDRHANSKGMADSLAAALAELGSAERHVQLVRDPAAYKAIDETYSLPKNRLPKGNAAGVPHDEARQFFKSHATRLLNQDRSRLDPEEKQLLDQRKANIRAAEKVYTALQREALGLPPPERQRNRAQAAGM
ncbi:hypothetical protein [Caenispirillum bisanense]|uniref:Uncharacterized protein n=1 Tax=Caenispirillum bisanense TaxID=414052 RepID=A0A286GTN1_9PROT|nr:hypothetical protein [Caenispirillum bisanense]SOD98556.1 hypothetical protein SAMN05421508_1088 [Caenispirillum bisanense]